MYSHFRLARKYIHYYLFASSGKGHGIHSPFVFDFVKHILNGTFQPENFHDIEKVRSNLLHNNTLIEVDDFGAGSGVLKNKKRVIKSIAASSLKPKKYASLLGRMSKHYQFETIIELGTSLGTSAAIMASSNILSTVYTLEGSGSIGNLAQENFDKLGLQNINLIRGDFDHTLPALLSTVNNIDMAFVDGNHRKAPVIHYFNLMLSKITERSTLIFDDIHWSAEMEEAWVEIKDNPLVTLTIDLFFMGLVFFRPDFKVKQHFVIRF